MSERKEKTVDVNTLAREAIVAAEMLGGTVDEAFTEPAEPYAGIRAWLPEPPALPESDDTLEFRLAAHRTLGAHQPILPPGYLITWPATPPPPTRDELLVEWMSLMPDGLHEGAWKRVGVKLIGEGDRLAVRTMGARAKALAGDIENKCAVLSGADFKLYHAEVERVKRWWSK